MRIIRYLDEAQQPVLAAVTVAQQNMQQIYRLPQHDVMEVVKAASAKQQKPSEFVHEYIQGKHPIGATMEELQLLVPIEAPEVWAAGVTYAKSREARNYEATQGKLDVQTYYDKVYDAERPELFFKSTAARTVGPNQPVYIRRDSVWQIPEPELGLVLSEDAQIIGYTIGNDMSSRDIEGENPLYLPQAKVWKHSCAIGPAILLSETVENPYELEIICKIYRDEVLVVEGSASTRQLKRTFDELVSYLERDNDLFDGTVLLTGTCIVPPNEFSLQPGDRVEIEIAGIGILNNPVQLAVK